MIGARRLGALLVLAALVLGAAGSTRPAEGPEGRQVPATQAVPRMPRSPGAGDGMTGPSRAVPPAPGRPPSALAPPASAPRAVAGAAGGSGPPAPAASRGQAAPPSALVRVQRAKPVTIKIRRTSKEEYAWELSGTNLPELLELDRRLRRELMGK